MGDLRPLTEARTGADFLVAWLVNDCLSPAASQKLRKYYGRFGIEHSPRIRHWYCEQLRDAEALIGAQPGLRVLEVGSGCGTESLWFALRGATVIALEPSLPFLAVSEERKNIMERALGRKLDCEFVCEPLLKYEDRTGFDLIWLEMAYHHCEPRDEVVSYVAQLLKPGGHLLIVEANALNPLLQLQLFWQRGFKTIVTRKDQDGEPYPLGNERITTSFAVSRAFARHGVQCQSVRFFRLFPGGRSFDSLFPLERAMPSAWPLPCFTHFIYLGRRRDR